jgi:hypothetical protein
MTRNGAIRIALIIVAVLFTTACDRSTSTSRVPPEVSDKMSGRWAVVPATNGPIVIAGTTYLFAWRLDTQPGNLELCTYDPGGWKNEATGLITSESLSCTLPAKGNPLE